MNGVHDLGGMHGFGPVVREENEPTFHADWEARVWGMLQVIRGQGYVTIDASRYGIERMPPAEYLRASYYERWLASLEYNLTVEGLVAGGEVEAKIEELRRDPDAAPRLDAVATPPPPRQHPASPPPPAPRFAVGDEVVTRNVHPVGHTRLPRYARGKRGVIQRYHGPQVFPDTNAHGLGEQPQPLYSVRFEARDLWGDSAEPRQTVSLDLCDSYLDPA
ncbi:MAG TPA: nitrile hydratase subunit beta [Thermomicrobiales bacterium]